MSKTDLRLDWCSHEAAKYAVEHWHYSRRMPTGKCSYIGVWENGKFIGAIVFGRGVNPRIGVPYSLKIEQVCELTRVALNTHSSPVSKILSIAIRMLKAGNPGLRLIVSYADTTHNHHGGIYQASNWVYTGDTDKIKTYLCPDGEVRHSRSVSSRGYVRRNRPNGQLYARAYTPDQCVESLAEPKHKYLYPLDDAMRTQIAPLAKPYPKRAGSADSGTSDHQSGSGGANPTPALSAERAQ